MGPFVRTLEDKITKYLGEHGISDPLNLASELPCDFHAPFI